MYKLFLINTGTVLFVGCLQDCLTEFYRVCPNDNFSDNTDYFIELN